MMFLFFVTVISILGLIVNANLAYGIAFHRPIWAVSRWFNHPYQTWRTRIGRWCYAIAIGIYLTATIGMSLMNTEVSGMVSILLDYYAMSTIPVWFMLEADWRRRNAVVAPPAPVTTAQTAE